MRNEKFALALKEKGAATIGEDGIAVDPRPGLGGSAFPMRIGGVFERTGHANEVRENEAGGGSLHCGGWL